MFSRIVTGRRRFMEDKTALRYVQTPATIVRRNGTDGVASVFAGPRRIGGERMYGREHHLGGGRSEETETGFPESDRLGALFRQ